MLAPKMPASLRNASFAPLTAGILVLLLAASLLPGAAAGQVTGSSRQDEANAPKLPVFEFHSGFWLNLHHFLYQQARLRKGGAVSPGEAGAWTPEEQQAWAAAVNFYAADLAGRDLLFNGDMVNIKNRLAELETCAELAGRSSSSCASGLPQGLIETLERAAPVYRAHGWVAHDRANRAWIAVITPLVRQLGSEIARQLASTYQAGWPAGRLRVDVVSYGGPFGAYTTLGPVHLTIGSADERNQGSGALEVLFHEASHALAGEVRDAIARECRTRGKPIPRELWHALLFYTTGEIVKRALGAPSPPSSAAPGYTPYAYRFGLYARGWSNYQRVLERYWQPYLDGKAEFGDAVARLVSNL